MAWWSSGKNKVFEVYVARICPCQWLETFSFVVGRAKGLGRIKK